MTIANSKSSSRVFIVMLAVCMLLLFYKYLLQLFPSVMTSQLMQLYHLNGAGLGNLAACYFYGYFCMQFFAGPLVDRYGTRWLATLSLLTAGAGIGLFATADHLITADIGRTLMGIGGAFATICYLRCVGTWCPKHLIAVCGGSLTLGVMLGACLGQAPLSWLVMHLGTQHALLALCALGLLLAIVCFCCLRDEPKASLSLIAMLRPLKTIITNKTNWLLVFYSGLAFAPLAVFGGLWGTPFIHAAYGYSTTHSAALVSTAYIGFGLGGPLFGYLSDRFGNRKQWMLFGLALTACCFIPLVYLPMANQWLLACLVFGFGLGTGAFMLGFTVGKELNGLILAGSIVGLINSGDAILGGITEPLLGHVLDFSKHLHHETIQGFSLQDFHWAFLMLVAYLFMATLLASFIPKQRSNLTR